MTPTTLSPISDQAAGELLPCPFCFCTLIPNTNQEDLYVRRYGTHWDHPSGSCFLTDAEVAPREVDNWNRRSTAPTTGSAPEPEPWEMDWPQYSSSGMGCGLEDRGIHDPYDAMRYGWDEAMEQVACVLVNQALYASPAASVLSDEQILAIWRKFAETGLCSDVLGLSRALLAASMGGDRT